MYNDYIYEAYCHECGDISISPRDKQIHLGLARKHHESTGHTCEVSEEITSTNLNGNRSEILSHDFEVIAVFENQNINQPG